MCHTSIYYSVHVLCYSMARVSVRRMIRCNLETLLGTKGWTRYRLSAESGVHNAVLAKYAKNEVQEFNAETLNHICSTLGCGVGELLEYVPDKPGKSRKRQSTTNRR